MEQCKVDKFVEYCKNILDLTNFDVLDKYNSLSICIIDCVYCKS